MLQLVPLTRYIAVCRLVRKAQYHETFHCLKKQVPYVFHPEKIEPFGYCFGSIANKVCCKAAQYDCTWSPAIVTNTISLLGLNPPTTQRYAFLSETGTPYHLLNKLIFTICLLHKIDQMIQLLAWTICEAFPS